MSPQQTSTKASLHRLYQNVKNLSAAHHLGTPTRDAIEALSEESLAFLIASAEQIPLRSLVPGKSYFSYRTDNSVTRPANAAWFVQDHVEFLHLWKKWKQSNLSDTEKRRVLYTTALAPCLAMELFDKQNKKGPATFFECLIGHLIASHLGKEPERKASLEIGDTKVHLTMDFLFAPINGKGGLHVPVKMSTRERVVQAWSHQAILDNAFGAGAYKGLMVLFSETKLDSKKLEVVEICVPDQWLAYQTYIAQMNDIYYFDLPDRYAKLSADNPELLSISTIEQII